jgi:lysophospholipase L1-like esterase
MRMRSFIMTIVLTGFVWSLNAQPFIEEIIAFRKQDSIHAPVRHPILFIGSSTFRKWTDINADFPSYPIVNRAFGGSSIPDVIRYADDVIFKYDPKQIIIYCGENDLTVAGVTGDTVFQRFKILYGMIRKRLPKIPVLFVSLKPSPSREKLWPAMRDANEKIRKFCRKEKRLEYLDVYNPMFNADGSVMRDIFLSDDLHMNKKGYAIWQPLIKPYLLTK